ncbi:tRNA (adenosine(37)-N6)-threonylcarbamoyltransferase complex dimerization subunit type 1 TsaB [Mycoplasmatota bacterium]|nr:tRNA (adenosine(37)-N6)-threonylcarbamoyltransferase complex dimerization subunit type 1 TsaB [Mycoplasmatota bacterium]
MKTIIFDVSTQVMYVGYVKDDQLVDFSIRIAIRDHAKYLVDRIDQVIKRNKLTIDDIDQMIVGIGPGSYTGLRVAVMVAKMIGYAKEIPIKTVSSLYFLTSGYEGRVAALIDARRGYVFSAVYENGKALLKDDYRFFKDLQENETYKKARTVFIDDRTYEVSAKRIIEKAVDVSNIHDLIPKYLRKTEAENNYDKMRRD